MNLINETQSGIDRILQSTDTAILFCLFGKDSLVLLDLLSKKFNKVICVFMYFVKGLEHIEKYIKWAEAKYPNLKLRKLNDVIKSVKLKHNAKYVFLGMKKADSLNRRLMLNTYKNNENNGLVYPLSDWTQKDIEAYIKLFKIPQPIRYSQNHSGGCGFNIECFLYLQRNYKNDLKKIIDAFPMSEKILIDHENRNKANRDKGNKANTD